MTARACLHCGTGFHRKPSDEDAAYCSRSCFAEARRTRPKNTPRPCEVCGKIFQPSRKRGETHYCSKSCVWRATRGPEFNRRIGREGAEKNGATQRRRGQAKGYVKYLGRHEHRVVAEKKLGRPLYAGEIVHHIDENKQNNHPDNLAVMTQAEHMREHGLGIPGVVPAHEPWKYRKCQQ